MRGEMSSWYSGLRNDDDTERWISHYVEELSLRRTGALWSWDSWKAFYAYMKGTKEWANVEHTHRRTIAILDEEIDLHKQSANLAAAARHFNKTVSSGCWCVM